MPKSPDGKPSGTSTGDPTAQLLIKMAESSQLLTEAVASLATSQASFMRSAADADANIGISKSHPFLPSELFDIRLIDNTVDDKNRNGLPASARDTTPAPPPDYVADPHTKGYDPRDARHANNYGSGHDYATPERSDLLNAYHRTRG